MDQPSTAARRSGSGQSIGEWDRPDRIRPLDIIEAGHRAGRYRWTADLLFDVLGNRARVAPELAARARLAAYAHRQRWHGELWRERLPELEELPPDDATASSGPAMDRVATALRGCDDTLELLAGVHRVVLPRLLGAYAHHLARTSALSDAPTIRTLGLVMRDCTDDRSDGELTVQALITSPDDVRRVARWCAELEALVVEAGGICGERSAD